ncbi:8-oxo-dGTP diphosphatase MutT [Flavobacteriaceae bacterium S356]|uniref:8-oxo-dGTP diphosphatase n=1 Tax=Asprobacillus argus TaxID=3076534 RepID=A0ABU3LDI7_9FLAO|nr:8-oxo-dGTP diphosphatase MutT [Flavobacteriaceae bacterium S356]
MIEVVAGIIYKEDKILIAKRKEGKHLAGYWEFPGGKIEAGETPEASLIREIEEELGITIEVHEHMGDSQFDYDEKQILLKGYVAQYLSGEMYLTDHDAVEWVFPSEFKNYVFAPADLPFIKILTYEPPKTQPRRHLI